MRHKYGIPDKKMKLLMRNHIKSIQHRISAGSPDSKKSLFIYAIHFFMGRLQFMSSPPLLLYSVTNSNLAYSSTITQLYPTKTVDSMTRASFSFLSCGTESFHPYRQTGLTPEHSGTSNFHNGHRAHNVLPRLLLTVEGITHEIRQTALEFRVRHTLTGQRHDPCRPRIP